MERDARCPNIGPCASFTLLLVFVVKLKDSLGRGRYGARFPIRELREEALSACGPCSEIQECDDLAEGWELSY